MNVAALYYPHIEFNNPNWLKGMSLYYDRIYRIVPDGIIPNDPEELQPLLEDDSIGKMIDPSRYSPSASQEFLDKASQWGAAALAHESDDEKQLTKLHEDKTDKRVRSLFESLGYRNSNGWLDIPTDLASNYMLYLAREIANKNSLNLITSDIAPWTAVNYFNLDGGVDELITTYEKGSDDPFGLFCLTIGEICPINISEIPSEDIVKFRRKRRYEIIEFRNSLKELHMLLCRFDDPVVFEDELRLTIGKVRRAHKEFKDSADIIKAGPFSGFLLQGFPGVLALANVLHLTFAKMSILFGTALAIGGVCNIKKAEAELVQLRKKYPVSLLSDIESSFSKYTKQRGGGDINYAAYNSMEEYVND